MKQYCCILFIFLICHGCFSEKKKFIPVITEEEIIAVINNKKISLHDFQLHFQEFQKEYKNIISSDKETLVSLKETLLNQMITEELLIAEASRRGIIISEQELEADGVSEKEWKEKFRRFLLVKKIIDQQVVDKIPITKREILNYYKKHRRKFIIPRQYKIRHIVVPSQEQAHAILRKLENGENFIKMVHEHSISPDKIVDGSLGYVQKGMLPSELENVFFKLKMYQFSHVIQTQQGFHILRLEGIKERHRLYLKQAKPQIKKILNETKMNEYFSHWMQKLRDNAQITINYTLLSKDEGF